MSDTIVKRVRTVFDADMSAMEGALDRSSSKASGLQNAFAGLGKYVAGVVGFVALKNLVQFTSGLESMRLSMGVLLQAGDKMRGVMTPFAASMKEAEGAMTLLRQAAVDTPATTKQVADAFNVLALKARAAGMATKELVALSANVATVDQMMGGQGVVARDIDQLLRGEGADVATAQLAPLRKELAALGKAGKHAEALKKISGALALDEDVKAAFGASAEGMFATLTDQWEMFKAEVGKPILKELMKAMKDLLKWVEKNRESVAKFAEIVGGTLVGAFRVIATVVKSIATILESDVGRALAAVAAGVGAVKLAFDLMKTHPVILALSALIGIGMGIDGLVNHSQDKARDARLLGIDTQNETILEKRKRFMAPMLSPAERATLAEEQFKRATYEAQQFRAERGVEGMKSTLMGKSLAWKERAAAAELAELKAAAGDSSFKDRHVQLQKQWSEFGPGVSPVAADFVGAFRGAGKNSVAAERDANLQKIVEAHNKTQSMMLERGLLPRATEKDEFGIDRAIKNAFTALVATVEDGKITFQTKVVNQDNRGSKVTVNQRIDTNDPSRLAGATLVGAFVGAFARPLSARVGLGGIAVRNN